MALPKLYEQITWVNDTTPALNEDNLNAMSQALDDIDDRVIDLAGTIMEDVPQILEDMEILGPAVENIDENVARAEAAAESAEQYAEEIAPPIEVVKDYAPIITMDDAINKAVKDLKVKVDAVQDLHGYTKPWVGGAGKNKLPLTVNSIKTSTTAATWTGNVYTQYNTTFEILVDGANNVTGIKINTGTGGATGQAGLYFCGNGSGIKIPNTANQTLTMSGLTNGIIYAYKDTSWHGTFSNNTVTIGNDDISDLWIAVPSGGVVNNVILKPQLELGSAATAWEQYENISPITGHSQAKVTRAAHNLLPFNLPTIKSANTAGTWSDNTYTYQGVSITFNADGTCTANGQAANQYKALGNIFVKYCPNFSYKASYKFSGCPSGGNVNTYSILLTNASATELLAYDAGSGGTYNADVSDSLISIRILQNTVVQNMTFSPMVEVASDTNTAFEPYKGHVYTIDLDDTRYGGVLDVDAGTLTVLSAFDEYDGSNDEDWVSAGDNQFYISKTDAKNKAYIITNEYEGVSVTSWSNLQNGQISTHPSSANNILRFRDDSLADVTALRAKFTTTPLQVVYELATPQTITLTPTEVTLLWEYNTLFADTGDLALTYDASGVLRIANAKLDIDTFKSVVAASSDFADFKTRVAAL